MSITFITVLNNQEKPFKIVLLVQRQFERGKRIQIGVPNLEAAQYMDQYLWRQPEESFIPHCIATEASDEPVVIAVKPENLNKAHVLINLCPTINPMHAQFETIFELMDKTHPEKEALSKRRAEEYRALKLIDSP